MNVDTRQASVLRDGARQRLLAAGERCALRNGSLRIRIADVAREAGVSRPTVYRHFEDADALRRDTAERLAAQLALALVAARIVHADPARAVVETVLAWIGLLARDPRLELLARERPEALTTPAFFAALAPSLPELPTTPSVPGDESTELALRLALSFAGAPRVRQDEAALRGLLMRRLLPALGLQKPRTR